ncbi:MAG: ISKra4 family transposase [Desulfohalobiaceae bacterium]
MSAAEEIIPTAEDGFEAFRAKAHEKLDEALEKLRPLFSQVDKPNLEKISEALQEFKQDFSGALLQEAAHSLHREEAQQGPWPCPQCGKLVGKLRDASREIETKHGRSLLSRPYYYCRHCKHGFSPLDESLGLSQGRKQRDLQQLALKFLARIPFDEAQGLFCESTGVPFSDHCMHKQFSSFADGLGPKEVIPSQEEIERRIDQARTSERRPVLVAATDGAHVPTRPESGSKRGQGEYKEAKGFRIYLNIKDRIVHLASWHQIDGKEEIIRALKLAAQRIPQDRVRIGLIGDGAHWLWETMEHAFPSGRQILDYYHVKEYIHRVAEAQYPYDAKKALHWVESTMARLNFQDGARHVIAGLRRMQPFNEEAKEQIRKTANYLERNKHRIHYRGDRIGGYPIGSGGVESANKFICHTRLKRSGAWWLKQNSNKMLALRCSLVNGTFDQIFSRRANREKAKGAYTNG